MMSVWDLPHTLNVCGVDYEIREDFRAILDILSAFDDDELTDAEKTQVMIEILYPIIPPVKHLQEAVDKALWFIDCGMEQDDSPKPRTMAWEKDAAIIFPAVNKIAGFEVRRNEVIHWWTFYGWFMEIDDGLFSQVLSIRQKLEKGKKLEKWEREFLSNNRKLCELDENEDKSQKDYEFFSELLK